MSRYVRPASFVLFTAIGAALIYAAYATPLPAATPPTATVPTTPRIVLVTRIVIQTPRPTALPTVSAWMLTATASAEAAITQYTWPTPADDPSCAYRIVEGCVWQTPAAAPTTAPLEGFGH